MIRLEPSEREIIDRILKRYFSDREVLAFGSRVVGTPKPFSDIDLCVMGELPISLSTLADARDAFTESDLPFRVDIVEWATTSEPFRAIVKRDGESFSLID